jgi:hypothetical protein
MTVLEIMESRQKVAWAVHIPELLLLLHDLELTLSFLGCR